MTTTKPLTVTPERFREKREELGLSRKLLGKKIERTIGCIYRWETGRAPIPKWAWFILSTYNPEEELL